MPSITLTRATPSHCPSLATDRSPVKSPSCQGMEPINAFPLKSSASSLDSVDNDAGNVPTSKFDGKMRLLHKYGNNIPEYRVAQFPGLHVTSESKLPYHSVENIHTVHY